MTTLLFRPSGATGITPPVPVPPRPTTGIANALFEISYTDPNDPKEWVDETAYLRRVSFSRGSNDELEQPQAGRLTAEIDNRTGRFSPTNTAGAHYPNVLPVRSVRLSAEIASTSVPFTMRRSNVGSTDVLRGAAFFDVPLFTGFVEQWPQEWDVSDADATAPIGATDGFALLNLPRFRWGQLYLNLGADPTTDWPCNATSGNVTPANGPPYVPNEETGVRMHRVLDCMDWPQDQRDIDPDADTGPLNNDTPFTSPGNLPVDDTALNYIRSLALMDGGRVFMDPRGYVKFIAKRHLPTGSPEVYGDDPGELGYTDIVTSFGLDRLWNSITASSATPGGTSTITRTDATSITRFYERSKSVDILYGWDSNEDFLHILRADELLERFKDPITRITTLSMRPTTGTELRTVLRHDLADVVTVRRRPSSGEIIEQVSRIDQIDVTTTNPNDWLVTWQLSAI